MKPKLYTTSKYAGKTYSDTAAPFKVVYFEHDFGGYTLEARVTFNEAGDWPHVMSIHGARSDYTKANAMTFQLAQQGVSILAITMSGHTDLSPLKPEETSLGSNIREAEAFFEYLDDTKKRTVVGYSLGGTPAIKLLDLHLSDISKLVLFYPAIYATEAYSAPYGAPFREILHRPFSYIQNDTLALLEEFEGSVLLIKGEYDGLEPGPYGKPAGTSVGEVVIDGKKMYSPIPRDVIDMIIKAVPEVNLSYIEVPGADHGIVPWMGDHPTEAAQLVRQVARFINV